MGYISFIVFIVINIIFIIIINIIVIIMVVILILLLLLLLLLLLILILGGILNTVVAPWTAGQTDSDQSCTWGMSHKKFISLAQVVPAQYNLTVHHRGLKHHSFFSTENNIIPSKFAMKLNLTCEEVKHYA